MFVAVAMSWRGLLFECDFVTVSIFWVCGFFELECFRKGIVTCLPRELLGGQVLVNMPLS